MKDWCIFKASVVSDKLADTAAMRMPRSASMRRGASWSARSPWPSAPSRRRLRLWSESSALKKNIWHERRPQSNRSSSGVSSLP